MPANEATTPIQRGKPGGRHKASRMPVMTTLQSCSVLPLPPRRANRYSVAMATAVVVKSKANALMP